MPFDFFTSVDEGLSEVSFSLDALESDDLDGVVVHAEEMQKKLSELIVNSRRFKTNQKTLAFRIFKRALIENFPHCQVSEGENEWKWVVDQSTFFLLGVEQKNQGACLSLQGVELEDCWQVFVQLGTHKNAQRRSARRNRSAITWESVLTDPSYEVKLYGVDFTISYDSDTKTLKFFVEATAKTHQKNYQILY